MLRSIKIFFVITYLFAFQVYGQQEIVVLRKSKCDSTTQVSEGVKFKLFDSKYNATKSDYAIRFTKKKKLKEYLDANKLSNNTDCMNVNFKKYDLILFSIETSYLGQLTENNLKVIKKENSYVINLNFILKRQDNSIQYTFFRYMLIPKSKNGVSNFIVYESFQKCY